ncbi:Cu(I)-responsive transcriptional regulator [Roseinatronobacter bogoriensis]|uniref:Cu(I)-responsive transcriptional regulator n=1 Tax=Roseinatronobacter bogoriensis subsp. barguzinensis TaxID=441209 RepID=A0A2K8KA54_9RHOB|nr:MULTISPECIES: Cu(I)-responsive transcriptional regulator [Rhodobaca]ATX66304.1 Cu(I)-responsive transcriptional regulator [Rhodobaca barguzinensis]MBB4207429.1 Cu(I)-responsive transcriptional regulator [Rhodobaca bogoriensis DSM 18756]TDW40265.1 Cu(I)-responsive transcriptional regulator [Rhodobaca barguzinensis]TDY70584.1 Cu(I)-responsive transcriptional regulator [Rhodobaca bogoriensis DSM 18756]
MNISEVGKRSGLPPKTIRFYDDIGLIQPKRDTNGYRIFSESDLHRLAFLRRARALGFSVQECRQLLALYHDDTRASADVKALARTHLARIDQQLEELGQMRRTLADLIDSCAGDSRPDCPILRDLAR